MLIPVAFLGSVCGTTEAATYIPTRLDDPAGNACPPQDCSLRGAVLAANASLGSDRIELGAGTYALTDGELPIMEALEIVGLAAGVSHIDAGGLSIIAHAFEDVPLTMRKLSLEGPPLGRAPSMPHAPVGAARIAIKADGGATLTLSAMRVVAEAGSVEIVNNTASDLIVADSLLWRVLASQPAGSITLTDSDLGFGIFGNVNPGGSEVDINILRSMIAGDDITSSGLMIETRGSVHMAYSDMVNTTNGLLFQGDSPSEVVISHLGYRSNWSPVVANVPLEITISDSDFSNNVAVFESPGAIIAGPQGHWQISDSAFINNLGNDDLGGAILVDVYGPTEVIIENSTFSGNSFTDAAASTGARGAAIGVQGGAQIPKLTLRHVTMVAPTTLPAGVEGTLLAIRGTDNQSHVTVHSSILRGGCSFLPLSSGFDAAKGNIESSGNTCLLNAATNIVSATLGALALGSLDTHGGWTRNYLPGGHSIAIDAAPSAFCPPADQRHYVRPSIAACDVGAIEVGALGDAVFIDEFE
ncbi:MAG TPA: choice-of-anchor Q domain-containing protein [Pseudomonadota bacterium]|nr:hypothetical protein [Xanthomonadales bacterium]HQW81382.1 choice-of-anchor Q domain-containing protein [Pseudomonadota bacterium]